MNNKFWLVWREESKRVVVKHDSKEMADTEAERLSEKHPGFHFHVMSCENTLFVEAKPEIKAKEEAVRRGLITEEKKPVIKVKKKRVIKEKPNEL